MRAAMDRPTADPVDEQAVVDPTANKAPVVKPTVQANDPVTQQAPALPVAGSDGSAGGAQSKGSDGTAGGAKISTDPVGPTTQAPTPLQTTDPLAFSPVGSTTLIPSITPTVQPNDPSTQQAPTGSLPTPAGYYSDPGITDLGTSGQITETGSSFLPPDLQTAAIPVPEAQQIPVPTSANGTPVSTLTPTTPSNSLLNTTITAGPGVDRYALAQQYQNAWDTANQPVFDRNLQKIAQSRAGMGQIGSGQLRGANRDALNDYTTQRTAAGQGFLADALKGSIDDAWNAIGLQERQQLFQKNQSDTAFDQQVKLQTLQDSEAGQLWTQQMQAMGWNAQQIQQAFENAFKVQQLSDDETGQAFSQAMQQYLVGSQGSPEDFYKYLAGIYALPAGTNAITA